MVFVRKNDTDKVTYQKPLPASIDDRPLPLQAALAYLPVFGPEADIKELAGQLPEVGQM